MLLSEASFSWTSLSRRSLRSGPPWPLSSGWIRTVAAPTGSASASRFWAPPFFAFARTRRGHIPQEAFIGIAYAVASAMAILLMSKATGETEHLKDMLVGNILAVSRPEVIKTALLLQRCRTLPLYLSQKISCSSP